MSAHIPKSLKDALDDRVAESIAGPLDPGATSRDVYGTVSFPGKVTAVVYAAGRQNDVCAPTAT
jgi:hypothetical protein